MCECELVAAVARSVPALTDKTFGMSIWCTRGHERVEASYREGRWLWTLRERSYGIIKGHGHCATAREALKMAFAAASFTSPDVEEPPNEPLAKNG